MTIEIHQPELEAILQQRMESGRFASLEEVIAEALLSSKPEPVCRHEPAASLDEVFARARAIGGVELDIARHPVADRPLDL